MKTLAMLALLATTTPVMAEEYTCAGAPLNHYDDLYVSNCDLSQLSQDEQNRVTDTCGVDTYQRVCYLKVTGEREPKAGRILIAKNIISLVLSKQKPDRFGNPPASSTRAACRNGSAKTSAEKKNGPWRYIRNAFCSSRD
jgi:hypothetical protein